MQPRNLQELKSVTDKELSRKRREEIESYKGYYEAVLEALQPEVIRTLGTGYFFELHDGTLEVDLYGKLFPTADKEKLWDLRFKDTIYGGAVNGDRSWAGMAGEQLVIILGVDKKFIHRLQEGKHEELARNYNLRYEDLDEPENYNYIWLWPLSEYSKIEMPKDFFKQRGRTPDAETQTLYERVLTTEDVAKHPIFAQCAQREIERISEYALERRTQIKSGRERTIRDNEEVINKILVALKGR